MSETDSARTVNSLGRVVYFDPKDVRGQELGAAGGEPYPNSLALWRLALALRQDWEAVVDVGANYGEMIVGAELAEEVRVVAFEPNPQVAVHLRRTLAELGRDVELAELAVADRRVRDVDLVVNTHWSGVSHLASAQETSIEDPDTQRVRVQQTSLDEYFAEPPGSICIKIDVEGSEHRVLAGAKRLFGQARHVAVMIEILHMPVQDVLDLSREHPMYLLDLDRQALIKWNGRDGYELGRALHQGNYLRQDALFLAGSEVKAWDALLTSRVGSTAEREQVAKAKAAAERTASATRARQLQELRLLHDRTVTELADAQSRLIAVTASLKAASLERDKVFGRLESERSQHAKARKQLAKTRRRLANRTQEIEKIKSTMAFRLARRYWRLSSRIKSIFRPN